MYGNNMQNINYNTFNQIDSQLTLGTVQNGFLDNSTRARLFLFSPSEMALEVARSPIYNFTSDGFAYEVANKLNEFDSSSEDMIKSSYLYDLATAHTAIQVSANGRPIDLTPFSQMWKFILVVDNDYLNLLNGARANVTRTNRVLATGICLDEPCNPHAVNGRTSINVNCNLQILHQTYVTVDKGISANGYGGLFRVHHDKDIIVPHIVRHLDISNNSQVLLDPAHVRSSYRPDGFNEFTFAPVDAYLSAHNEAGTSLVSNIKSPRKHLQSIIKPFFAEINQRESNMIVSPAQSSGVGGATMLMPDMEDIKRGFDNTTSHAYKNMNVPVSTGIDPLRPVTIDQLATTYPNIHIQPCKVPVEIPVDVANPMAPTLLNIMTSIVTSSVPSVLTECGLSHVSFSYISDAPSVIKMDNGNWSVTIDDIAPILPEDRSFTKQRWDTFLRLIQDQIFATIIEIAGHFEVHVSAQGSGACYVNLNLLEQGLWTPECTTTNNIFGSVTTPMIGTVDDLNHNVTNFASMIPQIVAGVSRY